jgi:hypothetical protein
MSNLPLPGSQPYSWRWLAEEILYKSDWRQDPGASGARYPGMITTKVEALRNADPMMPNPRQHSISAIAQAVNDLAQEIGIRVVIDNPPAKAPNIFISPGDYEKLKVAKATYLTSKSVNQGPNQGQTPGR